MYGDWRVYRIIVEDTICYICAPIEQLSGPFCQALNALDQFILVYTAINVVMAYSLISFIILRIRIKCLFLIAVKL